MRNILILSFLLVTICGSAQSYYKDTLFVREAITAIENKYRTETRSQSELYNGSDFNFYQPLLNENPYFLSDDWILGTIEYDHTVYTQVYLRYDIQSDEVIAEHLNGTRIKLSKQNIGYFILNGHTFILIPDLYKFYEVLYDGQTKAYASHYKTFQESISNEKLERTFRQKTRYFVYKDKKYISVNSKSAVYAAFKERKKELRQFASQNKLRFRTNEATFIAALAQHHDNLR